MSDLIMRDDAIKAINNIPCHSASITACFRYAISKVPAAVQRNSNADEKHVGNTLKRQTVKWIDYSDEGFVECPICGYATNCEDNIDELHYCFYCGARMESESE